MIKMIKIQETIKKLHKKKQKRFLTAIEHLFEIEKRIIPFKKRRGFIKRYSTRQWKTESSLYLENYNIK